MVIRKLLFLPVQCLTPYQGNRILFTFVELLSSPLHVTQSDPLFSAQRASMLLNLD